MPEQWTDAEPPKRGNRDWAAVAADLREHPGKWRMVFEQIPRSTQGSITQGRIKAFKADDGWRYLARTRNTQGTKADLWMSAERMSDG